MCLQLIRLLYCDRPDLFLVISYVRRITSNSLRPLLANNKAYLTLLVPERVCVSTVSPCGRYCTWWDQMVAELNPFLHHHHNNNNCLIINVIPIKEISLGPLTTRPSKGPTFEDLVKFEIRHVYTALLPGSLWYWFLTSTHFSSPVNIFDLDSVSLPSLSLTSQQVLKLSSSFNRQGTNLAEIRHTFRLSSKYSGLTQMKFPTF